MNVYAYRGATISVDVPFATIRFRSQEKDVCGRTSADALDAAVEWVDAAPELRP